MRPSRPATRREIQNVPVVFAQSLWHGGAFERFWKERHGFHFRNQAHEGLLFDHMDELRTVVLYKADAVDDGIVHEPPVRLIDQS